MLLGTCAMPIDLLNAGRNSTFQVVATSQGDRGSLSFYYYYMTALTLLDCRRKMYQVTFNFGITVARVSLLGLSNHNVEAVH